MQVPAQEHRAQRCAFQLVLYRVQVAEVADCGRLCDMELSCGTGASPQPVMTASRGQDFLGRGWQHHPTGQGMLGSVPLHNGWRSGRESVESC